MTTLLCVFFFKNPFSSTVMYILRSVVHLHIYIVIARVPG